MIVGVMTVELAILNAQSLKDKRQIILSLKKRIGNTYNVSIAETAHGDAAKRCQLGIALVSNETRAVHSQLDKVIDMIRRTGGLTMIRYEREVL